jgi:hypothetical protein
MPARLGGWEVGMSENVARCHGPAPWSVTLVAIRKHRVLRDATTLRRGDSRWLLLVLKGLLQQPT